MISFTPSRAREESLPLQCPLCESSLEEGRCERCGAAAMPGGFLVRRLLSRSAHGRLYVAEAPDGTLVALKELVFSLVPEVRQLEAFEREARLLREVSHPHIPRFVASFQEGRGVGLRLYLAQELIQGTSLRELLRERCLREEEALEVARQVLDVLCYLHELSPRIVHRDVKPANLVRREDGKTFLVDFGAARDLFGSGTAGATMVGTFGYMPPEQLGGTLDATCDLYALGASLLHLLSGKHPEELLAPDLSLNVEAHAVLSPKMTRFLRKLVARDPAKRFRSARDARLALESSSGDNRLHWRRAAVAGLVLAVVTGGAVQGWRWSSAAPAPVTKAPPPDSLEDGNRAVAVDDSPSPPLLTEDFSRGLRRWIPRPVASGVVQEFEVIKDKGNPVLRLSHQAPSGRADMFRYLLVEPRPAGKSGVSRVWLEFDAMLERAVPASGQSKRDRNGAGLVMQLVLILHRDGEPETQCFLDVDLRPHTGRPYSSVGPALQQDSHVVFSQPVRLGHWQHVKLELNSLIATLGAGTIQQVGIITLIGYGANTEGFLDNLSLVEE